MDFVCLPPLQPESNARHSNWAMVVNSNVYVVPRIRFMDEYLGRGRLWRGDNGKVTILWWWSKDIRVSCLCPLSIIPPVQPSSYIGGLQKMIPIVCRGCYTRDNTIWINVILIIISSTQFHLVIFCTSICLWLNQINSECNEETLLEPEELRKIIKCSGPASECYPK